MEILTEWDVLQEAMKKIDLSESTMPYVRGKLCESKAYNEMQKILAAPELIKSHNYILNLDPEQLSEDEIDKVQKIYDLGVNRGFIQPSDDEDGSSDDATQLPAVQDDTPAKPQQTSSQQAPSSVHMQNVPCWTVLYSACNADGEVKTGQCYSNSINIRSAKADCYAKLERCGYTNVKILAIEAGDPDSCGPADDADECPIDKNVDKLAASNADDDDIDSITVTENDMLKRRPSNGRAQHNGHFSEADHSIDDLDDEGDEQYKLRVHMDNDEAFDAAVSNDKEFNFKQLFTEFITAADDFVKTESYSDADDPRLTHAFNDVKAAYEDAAAAANDQQLVELENEAKEHGLKVSDDGVTIVDIDKSEDVLDECGNPYAAGMKTFNVSGAESCNSAKRQAAKKSALKKVKIDEDDEDDSSSDSSSDDGEEDTSSEDTSSSEDADSTSPDEADDSNDSSGDDTSFDDGDDSSDEENEDDSSSDADDDSSSDEDDSSDDPIADDIDSAEDDDSSDDSSEDDDSSDDEDEDDSSDDSSSDDEDEDDSSEDDDSSEEDEEDEDDEEKTDIVPAEDLTDEQKFDLKNEYKKTFKDIMMRCKFEEVNFDDLSIRQKMKFFTKLNKAWRKNEPQDFMTDKEIEQLNKVVIKK